MADPDLAHFNVASLITSTDTQISKEAPFFKDIKNLRLIYRSIDGKYPTTFSKDTRFNIRTGLRFRYESTAVKEEDIYRDRVSALGFVLFWVIIPRLDRNQVSATSGYLWTILIQCLSSQFEAKQPPGEDLLTACGKSTDKDAVFYRLPTIAKHAQKELEAEHIKYAFNKRLEQDTARIESAAAREVTKATQQIREKCKKDLEEARALLTEEFREQLGKAAELERTYKKPTNTLTPQGDGGGSDYMLQAGQAEVRGIGCRQTEDDPSVPKSLNTTGVSSASNATERIHPLSSTKSSNTPPANPPQIPKEDNVNPSSGNNALPNGIGQSASIVAPDIPQVAAHQGADELRAAKRQRIEETSSVPEPVPQIHASSAMPSTLDAQSVHQCVMRLLDLATTLAKTLEDGGESGQLRQGGWDGAHHPPPPMSMRPSNTSSANSSRLLTENDVNSPPANNLRPDEPASINTPVSEQVDERSDTTVGGDGQHLKKRRRVDEVGSSQLNPRAHSNFSILHANDYFSPETSNPLTEGHGDSPFSSTQVSAKHPSSQEKSGIKRRPKEEKEPIRAVNKYLETVLENCGPGDRTQDKAQPTTSKDVNFAASTNEIIAVMRIQMNKWYPLLGSNEADDGPIKILPANQPFHVYLTQQLPLRLRMWLNGKGNEVENLPDYEIQGSTLCDYLDHWLSGGHFNVKWEGCAQTNICVTIEKQKQEMTIFFGWKRGREALRRIYESRPKPKDKR